MWEAACPPAGMIVMISMTQPTDPRTHAFRELDEPSAAGKARPRHASNNLAASLQEACSAAAFRHGWFHRLKSRFLGLEV
jgi:hypothetical protein